MKPVTPDDVAVLVDFVDTAAVGLHWVGPDGTILWANPADYEPLGYARDEYIGHSIAEFHADSAAIADILRRLSDGERLDGYEAQLRCKDGSTRFVEITSSVRFEDVPSGRAFRNTRCFTIDVTSRKKAERRLRFVADALPALVAYINAEQRYEFANHAYEEWFGASAQPFVGKRIQDVFGDEAYAALQPHVDAALAGHVATFETELRFTNGERRFVKGTYIPEFVEDVHARSPQRIVSGLVVLILDVTEERRTAAQLAQLSEEVRKREEEYRRLAESLPDVVARYDRQYRHLYVNPAATRATGLSVESFIGKTHRDLDMPAALCTKWEAALARAFLGETVRVTFDYPSPTGTLSFETQFAPERHPDNHITSVLAISRDVTDARRALLGAETMRAQLEDASRAKDAFLAMLGHELRNPLAPILTAVQLMQMRAPDTLVKERTIIERQVRHVVCLVDDLLDVSRITQGKIELRKRALDLNDVVTKAVEQASPLLEERAHHLTTDLGASSLVVNADETRLSQVFANLLTNAAKYTPPNGSIAIKARRDGDRAIISVEDNGIGIPADLLPNVFTMFIQGKRTIERGEGGLGLGLAIVRSLVEMHGGAVAATSIGQGHGSTFTVTLPLLTADASASPSVIDAATATAGGTSMRVLVVDDNRDAADLLADMLSSAGHQTAVAYDGLDAVEQFERFAPDVALVDLGLPVMDGYEVARRIRASASHRPAVLIAVTGYGQSTDRERVLQAGFAEHLVKPVDFKRITTLLDGLASNRR